MNRAHRASRSSGSRRSRRVSTNEQKKLGRYWVDGARQVNSGGAYRAVCLACGGRIQVQA